VKYVSALLSMSTTMSVINI